MDANDKTPQQNAAFTLGFAVGAAGGNVADVAQFQYILSRVLAPGQQPSSELIGRIVGMMKGSIPQAVIIDSILKKT
jgi:hypothetical protein